MSVTKLIENSSFGTSRAKNTASQAIDPSSCKQASSESNSNPFGSLLKSRHTSFSDHECESAKRNWPFLDNKAKLGIIVDAYPQV